VASVLAGGNRNGDVALLLQISAIGGKIYFDFAAGLAARQRRVSKDVF